MLLVYRARLLEGSATGGDGRFQESVEWGTESVELGLKVMLSWDLQLELEPEVEVQDRLGVKVALLLDGVRMRLEHWNKGGFVVLGLKEPCLGA